MRIKAYAKVNLCLKVYKKDETKKHKIDSIFYLYKKLHDSIIIHKHHTLSIVYIYKGKIIRIDDCLIKKALMYLNNKYNFDINYRIIIKKRIPFGSGLGGGSSDAAAIFNYVLKHNKNINLNLNEIAMEVGSDIPFFLSCYKIARVQGYGDIVDQIYDWQPKIKIYRNKLFCSTKDVFDLLDQDKTYQSRVNVSQILKSKLYNLPSANVVYNDLTKYIILSNKDLMPIYKKFDSKSFFTGAGSTIIRVKGE